MLHNTGAYGPNETQGNMGAPLNMSQLTTPMKMVQNLNNLAKMPVSPNQPAGGHFNLPNYPSYSSSAANASPQLHHFQNYHSLAFQPISYLPDRSSMMLNPAWPSSIQPMTMTTPGDHAQNMMNFSQFDKKLSQPLESYKNQHCASKTPLNIPQVPNKLYQTHSDPSHNPENTFNNHYKSHDSSKDAANLDLSMKSPESLLNDNTRRKNLENTVRLIENILINTTKNREMQLNNETQEYSQKSSQHDTSSSETELPKSKANLTIESSTIDNVHNDSDENDNELDDIPEDSDDNDKIENMSNDSENKCDVNNDTNEKVNRRCGTEDKLVKETVAMTEVSLETEKETKDDEGTKIKPVIIKEEPMDLDKEVEVKIEEVSNWMDTDSTSPYHRDVNGVLREDATHGNILDGNVSVVEATKIIKNGPNVECYFECPHCCLLFEHPKRFLIHTKWHSFGLTNKQKIPVIRIKEDRACTNRVRECKMCTKRITGWTAWKAHLASHNTDAGYQCNECPKRFKYSHSLAKHKDTHLEKTHACPECPKKFGSQALLKVHMKSHERAKLGASFHCTFCGKSFYDKFNLQIHERTHTNERPFVCEICNATFGCNSNLSRHLKVSHSASKPHVCSTCNRSFATELIRDRHELRVHGDPEEFKYTCKQCPSRYMKLVDLRKHTYKMHPKPKLDKEAK